MAGNDIGVLVHHDGGGVTEVTIDGRDSELAITIDNRSESVAVTVTMDDITMVPVPNVDWEEVRHDYQAFQDEPRKAQPLLDVVDTLARALGHYLTLTHEGKVVIEQLPQQDDR